MKDIRNATDISDLELKRQLQSIACAKFKILKKHPPSRDIDETDSFTFNADFIAPTQRIKIPVISSMTKVENVEERRETMGRVEEQRSYQIDVSGCVVVQMPLVTKNTRIAGLHCSDHEKSETYDA